MRKILLAFSAILCHVLYAQQSPAVIDSMKASLEAATTAESKVEMLGYLAMTLMNTNLEEADLYGARMSREAELSRDRKLIVKAMMVNGQRYSFFMTNKEFLRKSREYFNAALEVARKHKLDKETAEALLWLSTIYTAMPDADKAMSYATQAAAIVASLENDSLKVASHYSIGAVYQVRKEKIMALRSYLMALRVAEEARDPLLMRSCYSILSRFYADINEHDKAIDYLGKAADQLPHIENMPNKEYNTVVDLYMMGDLYIQKRDFEMAVYFYDSSIKKAEELKFYPLKMPGYRGILRRYIQDKQPAKALAYLDNSDGLKQFIVNMGFGYMIDHTYGAIYTQLGNYDSARYYFEKALPFYEKVSTSGAQLGFYYQYADLFSRSGDKPKAVEYLNRAMSLANRNEDLEWQQRIAKELDTVYAAMGDFRQSRFYAGLYHKYEDSLQKLGEEKDLMQMELADEEQRQRRIQRENAERLRERHNIQYLGITIAIAVVFLLLVMMGAFRVSQATIKVMGFFAFILLFEFIILIADNKIHHWTHGEPLPILGIKIVLIAMLLPLHHWMEHKVVSYLASRRLIIPDTKSIWNSLTRRAKHARPEKEAR